MACRASSTMRLLFLLAILPFGLGINIAALDQWLSDHADETLKRLVEFVSIPSVSADPSRKPEVRRAADWLKLELTSIGLENAQFFETKGHPSVYADWLHAPGAPTILIYGHFDVQPEDPVDLWTTPPFKPTLRDGRLYARGATDDKGNMYVPVTTLKAYLEVEKSLPVNVKVLFEGEEEVGSPNMFEMLKNYGHMLSADYAFSADGGQPSSSVPGLCLGLRGSGSLQVNLRVADVDMHSGQYGGGVQNPIHILVDLLGKMRDVKTGRILVDGFYKDVEEMTAEERNDIADFEKIVPPKLETVGVNESAGEEGFSFYERTTMRPTMEVVGIWGGFTGEGIKTVLPREAHAKISCRLVTKQDVPATMKLLRDHLYAEAEKIPGVSIDIEMFEFEADAFKMEKRAGANLAAAKVLKEIYGREPIYFSMGGSIPAMGHLRSVLGIETTMFAFSGEGENVHAPDEFCTMANLRRAERAYVRLFKELADGAKHESGSEDGKEEL